MGTHSRQRLVLVASLFACGCHAESDSGVARANEDATAASSSSSVPADACPPPPSPAVFEVGGGSSCFERIAPGQTVSPLIQGAQGGYHVWVGVGCSDCPRDVVLRYGLRDPVTHAWVSGTIAEQVLITLEGQQWPQFAGLRAFLPGTVAKPSSLLPEGTNVLVAASVIAADGTAVHDAEVAIILGEVAKWTQP